MSTYINTNTTASMAAQNLNSNNTNLSNDIEQLSTGLRINSASDDPAGLVVSENMKAQLSGLSQATANSNDAINMTQTAESALNQVQNLLISMRSLAVQASNQGVNDSTDTAADQTQITSMIASINRISSTTQFGNKNLLDGSSTSALTTTNGTAAASTGASFDVVAQGAWSTGDSFNYTSNSLSTTTAAALTYGTTDVPGGTPEPMTSSNTTFNGSIAINGTTYTLADSGTNTLANLNTSIASSGYQVQMASNGNLVFNAQADGPTTQPVVDMSKLAISGTDSAIATTGTATSATKVTFAAAGTPTGGTLPVAATVSATTPVTVSGTVKVFDSTNSKTFQETYAPGTSINQVQTDLTSFFGTSASSTMVVSTSAAGLAITSGGDDIAEDGSSLSAFNSVAPPASGTFVNGAYPALTLKDAANPADTLVSTSTTVQAGVNYYSFSNGLVLSSSIAANSLTTTAMNGSLQAVSGATTAGSDLEFQLGANSGQTVGLAIASTAADQLGKGAPSYVDANGVTQTVLTGSVADVNVSTFKGAQDAIQVIDQAITDVSSERASLGSFDTNVLQSNVTSLGVSSTNLQAAESTVTDADMASTIVDYTKNQILVSASTSALSYANQMPQSILKLLQQ